MPRSSKRMNDWEVELVARLLRILHGWWVSKEEDDRLVWEGGKDGVLFVRSLYLVLNRVMRCLFLPKPFGGLGFDQRCASLLGKYPRGRF